MGEWSWRESRRLHREGDSGRGGAGRQVGEEGVPVGGGLSFCVDEFGLLSGSERHLNFISFLFIAVNISS